MAHEFLCKYLLLVSFLKCCLFLSHSAQEQEAARLAKAIESQRSSNIHVAEERNQSTKHEFDEEDLYSGVARPSDPTKYRYV